MSVTKWKESPPGPEQIELTRMFQDKKIPFNAKPADIYNLRESFKLYPLHIFTQHFHSTKRQFGLNCKQNKLTFSLQPTNFTFSHVVKRADSMTEDINEIPEIAGGSGLQKKIKIESDESVNYIDCFNGPIIRYEFQDPVSKVDKMMVVIPKMGGIDDIRFSVDMTGTIFSVSFFWPPICCKPLNLFRNMTGNEAISSFHPKVVGFENELKNFREKKDEIPRGTISIKLPKQVQKEKSTIKANIVKCEHNQEVIMVELTVVISDSYNESIDDNLIK